MSNGEGTQNNVTKVGTQTVVCKRERLLDLDLNSEPEFESNKRSKQSEHSSSNGNSSGDSITTNEETRTTTYFSSMLLEVIRAKAMIKNLQSRVDQLTAENGELRRAVK
ncbi:uncharacterized protein [Rutidosis leptorrhynchoides]|uniref:uncharacterized protein n=1 Tax=Rutidosis leptorrhynchoides TaxID=125765 RepID=UPI003A99F38C